MNLKSCPPHPLGKKKRSVLKQALLIMRLIMLLTILSIFKVTAGAFAQQITINVKDAPIQTVLDEIKKQSGYSLITKDNLLDNASKVTITLKKASVHEALEACFKNQPLVYEIVGKTIVVKAKVVLRPAKNIEELLDLHGDVIDQKGNPLPGASIRIKGTSRNAISDEKGEFTLTKVPSNATLQISYIGYISREIPANVSGPLHIIMEISASKLDEVVIIPYGVSTQRLNTGSITKVTAEEIASQPVSNPLEALEGRVPGLTVTQANGVPGSPIRIELRGQNNLANSGGSATRDINSDPLFIIDGIPYAPGNTPINVVRSGLGGATTTGGLSPFSMINPADIESIEVLKDADATAIYGSRGGNGVILITTKKGKAGKMKLNANVYTGISQDTHIPQMMNTQQYLAMRREAFKNDGITPDQYSAPDLFVYDTTRYTNFAKMFLGGTAASTDAQLSISGGSENTSYLLGSGFHHDGTVYPGDMGLDRASFHFNLNNSSTDKRFNSVLTVNYVHEKNNLITTNLPNFITLDPDFPALTDAAGNLNWSYNGVALDNPLSYLKQKYTATTDNLISNLVLSYKLAKGLTLRSNFGYNKLNVVETEISPIASLNPMYNSKGTSTFGNNNFDGWSIEPQIEYSTSVSKGKLNVLVGGTWQYNENDNTYIKGKGYINDALLQSVSAAASLSTTSNFYEYKYQAFFGRLNYNWDEKYILNLTARGDGSSRFGPDRQFSNFGAIGAAWLFSNENFFKQWDSILSYAKLRGSFGITGTDQIGNYQYLDSWSLTGNAYQNNIGLYPTQLANSDYSWEKNKKVEIGLELGFLKDRFLLTSSYFVNTSSNHLISYNEPSQTGFTNITKNFPAVIQNSGLELTFTSKNIVGRDFNWSTSANITFQKNKLTSFPGIETSSYSGIYQVGQSLDVIQGFQYLGIDPNTGLFKYKDVNNDGTYSSKDFVNLGNFNPPFFGGVNNTFTYKNFQLNIFLEFKKQLGVNYLSNAYNGGVSPGYEFNQPQAVTNRWQAVGDNAQLPKYSTGFDIYPYGNYSSLLISDASYLRLKSFSLGYNILSEWTKKMHIQSLRIYAQGENLFTVTKFKFADPETQSFRELPPLRTFTAGIQLSL